MLCFLDGVDCCHKLNPTNQKAQLSFETSASLGLFQRRRQQVHIEICMSEVGSASELIIATELALFPFPVGRLIWVSADLGLAYVCVASAASFNFFPPIRCLQFLFLATGCSLYQAKS